MFRRRAVFYLVAAVALFPCWAAAQSAVRPREKTSKEKDEHRTSADSAPPEGAEASARRGDSNVVVIPVKNARAWEVAKVLQQLLPPMERGTVITVDEGTNAVILGGDPQTVLPKLQTVLAALDQPPTEVTRGPEFRMQAVALKHALADEIADRLPKLVGSAAGAKRMQMTDESKRIPTRFVADPRANVVWISGETDRVTAAAEYAAEMDKMTSQVGATAPRVGGFLLHTFPLRHADAEQAAGHVQSLLPKVKVVGDKQSGTLLAIASTEQASLIAGMVEKIDTPPRNPPPASETSGKSGD